MRRLLYIVIILSLYSCTENRLNVYNETVDGADRIVINFAGQKDSIIRDTGKLLLNLKGILKRGVKPTAVKETKPACQLYLYKEGRRTGLLSVSEKWDYVIVDLGEVNFGFPMTYGIGMALGDMAPRSTAANMGGCCATQLPISKDSED